MERKIIRVVLLEVIRRDDKFTLYSTNSDGFRWSILNTFSERGVYRSLKIRAKQFDLVVAGDVAEVA